MGDNSGINQANLYVPIEKINFLPSKFPPNGGDPIMVENIECLDIESITIKEEEIERFLSATISKDGNHEWEEICTTRGDSLVITTYRPIYNGGNNYHDTLMVNYVLGTISPSWYRAVHSTHLSLKQISVGIKNVLKDPKVTIVPSLPNLMNSLNYCPLELAKVIIISQGPYPWVDEGEEVANGMAFSSKKQKRPENSLMNIYKELERCYDGSKASGAKRFSSPNHGNLVSWAKQGVLLINSTLTGIATIRGKKNYTKEPHEGKWNSFVGPILNYTTRQNKDMVVMVWGQSAQKFILQLGVIIGKHLILKCAHPSGWAGGAKDKFLGCNHFIEANDFLVEKGKGSINWHSVMDA